MRLTSLETERLRTEPQQTLTRLVAEYVLTENSANFIAKFSVYLGEANTDRFPSSHPQPQPHMTHFTKYAAVAALALTTALPVSAQEEDGKKFTLHGSVQSDVLTFPQEDNKIGTGTYKDDFMTNTYAELHLLNKYFQAGARLEYLDHPLPGFEKDFKGWGLPYFYVKGNYKWAELTLGDFYDQFGSGLIFRTYEERSLGVDNSLRGGRLTLKPFKGVSLKVLGGQQRYYWHHRNLDSCSPWTYGGDLELNVDQWVKKMDEAGTRLTLGFSAVSNHAGKEPDLYVSGTTVGKPEGAYQLKMPKNVGAFDVRANLQTGNYNFLAEYAWKSEDPSVSNGYTYHKGKTLLLSGSYSKRGMSVLLQAKRSEDMAFRSRRTINAESSACYINHLPAFAMQHTYALAALYPYATQMTPGEWAFQAELGYNFKRRTALGGKYGTNVKVNFSHVRGIDQTYDRETDKEIGGNGADSKFFKMGPQTYYQDVNVQLEKKFTRQFKFNFMYSFQRYNQQVVENHGSDAIKSHIFVAEGKYQFSPKITLRGEAQYLHTKQDQGDWWYGLLELSVLPNFMFTISDQFNANVPTYTADGAVDENKGTNKVHYLMGSVTFTHKAHRLQLSYGKTRAGFNCSGGVCRFVPASKGLQASYSFNF